MEDLKLERQKEKKKHMSKRQNSDNMKRKGKISLKKGENG